MLTPKQRSQRAAIGGAQSWANTVDRTARTAAARSAGPAGDSYWVEQKRNDPKFADAAEKQIYDAAMAAKKAYYKRLAFQSAKARSRGGEAA